MVSVINHHLSILHLRVHNEYLDCLASDGDTSRVKNGLQMQRTRWYDFFDKDDRVLAMRGVWGALGWLMRGKDQA